MEYDHLFSHSNTYNNTQNNAHTNNTKKTQLCQDEGDDNLLQTREQQHYPSQFAWKLVDGGGDDDNDDNQRNLKKLYGF